MLSDWGRTTLGLPTRPGERAAAGCCDSCGRSGSNAVALNVTVGLGALLKLSDAPADLDGHPIPAALARELAVDGRWRRLVLEDHSGRLLDVGAHTYRPGEALSRWLVARGRTCRFPRCTVPAARCQLDHVRDFHSRHNGEYVHGSGDGETVEANLAANCQSHHRLKSETQWTYARDPVHGTVTWTASSGRTYTVEQDHYSDDPQLSAYLTGQTRRRQERERRKQPAELPPEYPADPPF